MIYQALRHISSQLNQFLIRSMTLSEDIVVVSNLTDHSGTATSNVKNKIVVFLVNIEKDTIPLQGGQGINSGASRAISSSPPLYLNLYVMIIANFSGSSYSEGLKFISGAISYFQKQSVFDHHSTPDLDPRIDKLILELQNVKFQDLSNLWSQIGGKYLPSVMYKIRMLTVDDRDVKAQLPLVSTPAVSVQS